MILLSGADVVLPDRVIAGGTVVIDGDRIVEILASSRSAGPGDLRFDLDRHFIAPGFIDVHVHGLEGMDALDGADVVQRMADQLPRYGVTAFCPTSIACSPEALRTMLEGIRKARAARKAVAARVLPAHLESNFINPAYKGAQPAECLRLPRGADARDGDFSGAAILAEIAEARADVGIVTVAPELDGCVDLIRELVSHGHHVSLGHSGATYDEALAGIAAGARQATHLFNRMPALGHRAPGLAGAVLQHEDVIAELVCDGVHVHPAMVRVAVGAKQTAGIMAVTDGTAGSGFPRGARASLGGRQITVGDVAYLDDGTIAGSVLTMDRVFANLVTMMGFSIPEAAVMCSTTPARALGMHGFGAIAPGAIADLVVLDQNLVPVHTFIAGTRFGDTQV
jgi:N-acetylglucosamine-6-phosphate deacetylase